MAFLLSRGTEKVLPPASLTGGMDVKESPNRHSVAPVMPFVEEDSKRTATFSSALDANTKS